MKGADSSVDGIIKLFKKIMGEDKEPYDYQVRAWKKIREIMINGGKVLIEVQTAGGKTEAAIMPFLHEIYENSWNVSRLIYVLPTRSLVERQAKRIKELVKKVYMVKGISYAEELSEKAVYVEYGLEKTSAFLGSIVVATWDAFLYGLAAQRTIGDRFTMPAGAIAQSLVVFDEVQMYQDCSLYMPNLFALVIKLLEKTNVPVVIMSATLPSKLKNIIANNAIHIEVLASDGLKPQRGNVDIEISKSFEDTLKDILINIENGKRVLVVRNTTTRAIESYEKLKDIIKNKRIILIHSRFTVEDRKKKENDIEKADIIVATQVVESGLDFENVGLVVTDIAPADALIQRIGRCARRAWEHGKAIVLVEESVGSPEDMKKSRRGRRSEKDKVSKFEKFSEILNKLNVSENDIKVELSDACYNQLIVKDSDIKLTVETNYSHYPYDPLVLLRTCDELMNTNIFKKCVSDTKITRDILDRVYKFHYENNVVPREYYSAYVYFKELKLFSQPPNYEIRSRPELYAMLYLGGTNFDPEKIIRVDFAWLRGKREIIEGKVIIKDSGEVEINKNFEGIEPFSIYKLNSKYYDSELGVI